MTGRAARGMGRTHVVVIDGTLSQLDEGRETNAGLLYKLLQQVGQTRAQTFYYDRGIQGSGISGWINAASGRGINRSIRTAYGTLCSRYRPGDRIMLFGFSRGAYAVRSLAGLIGRIGLLHPNHATERRIFSAFRHYQAVRLTPAARAFRDAHCQTEIPIDVLGVWDTVKSLGLPYPILNRLAPMATEFHDHALSNAIRNAYHAHAID